MEQYLIYLRKSRRDRELELQTGNFDTLQRHRETLLALAEQRGYVIVHIYEEVVSGDTISERPEMQKLLTAVETGAFTGVLVMEIPRLARGNTRDQGIVAETFQYSSTKIITPDRVYDPADESDEEYFEFGLFMSRREYKAINRRLQRGRMASLSEGKYIAGSAPYGYRRVRIPHQRGYTLEIVHETAEIVREIFRLYTVGDLKPDGTTKPPGSSGIAELLNARGILSPGGGRWTSASVRDILKNPTYAGYLRWSHRPDKKQMENGVLTVSHPINPNAILRKGLHPAIISEDTWATASSIMSARRRVPVPGKKAVANPLAGLLRCGVCGRSLVQLPQGRRGVPMVLCPTAKCPTVASRRDLVEHSLLEALSEWLENYPLDLDSGLQTLTGSEGPQAHQQEAVKLRKTLETLRLQKETLYDLLEQGVYTQEIFLERFRTLSARIAENASRLDTLNRYLETLEQATQETDSPPSPQNLLDFYDILETPGEKNALLKTVLDHAVYCKSTGGRQSDLRLYLYPKLPRSPSHL